MAIQDLTPFLQPNANADIVSGTMLAGTASAIPITPEWPSLPALTEGMAALGEAALTALGVVASSLTLSGDTQKQLYLNHYTDADGLTRINESRAIVPNEQGKAYFTPEVFWSSRSAQESLQVNRDLIGYYRVPMQNVMPISSVGPVPGGSAQEYIVTHPVSIEGATWIPISH